MMARREKLYLDWEVDEQMEIRTPRLLLRDFVESDVPSVWGYQSDPRYLQHTPWKTRTENEAREFVRMLIGWANDEPRTKYQLAIVREGSVIGTCGIRRVSNEDHEAEFGCEIDPRVWGNGYAKEAGGAMLEFAFRTLRIHRVFSETVFEKTRWIRSVRNANSNIAPPASFA